MSEYDWEQAARLRCLREYLGLSVSQMCAALGVKERSFQAFESGRAAIPRGVLDDAYILCDRLDALAEEYAAREVLYVGRAPFEVRAASIAARRNRQLVIRYDDRRRS